MAIAAAAGLLTCPHCGQELVLDGTGARCAAGHSWDLARQGYLNLLAGPQPRNADSVEMLAARSRVLDSGLFDPLLELVAGHTRQARRILEVGAGTAHYLRHCLRDDPAAAGVALPVSLPAARLAAFLDREVVDGYVRGAAATAGFAGWLTERGHRREAASGGVALVALGLLVAAGTAVLAWR